MFDFTQTPVAFTPIATRVPPAFFIRHPADLRPADPDHEPAPETGAVVNPSDARTGRRAGRHRSFGKQTT